MKTLLSDTGTALLRAILLSPDDDAPRLVFADWLDENGEPERAALIRWMVRVPSYRFFWRQSLRARRPKHEHAEAVTAIRGLKPRLTTICREEWGNRPGVEQVVVRRGFAEAVTLPAHVLLATAGELFAAHPFQHVELSDLRPRWSWELPNGREVTLTPHTPMSDFWPAVLFPEKAEWDVIVYPSRAAALADLSRRAAGFGRRTAGVIREPPPLPNGAGGAGEGIGGGGPVPTGP